MISVDTNIVVRLLVGGDKTKRPSKRRFLKTIAFI